MANKNILDSDSPAVTTGLASTLQDTPVNMLDALAHHTHCDGLDNTCQTVVHDIGPVPTLSFDDFIVNAMPRDVPLELFTDERIENIMDVLVTNNILITKEATDEEGETYLIYSWNVFDKAPSKFIGDESEAFANFKVMYESVSDAARKEFGGDRDVNLGVAAITCMDNTSNYTLLSEANNSS